MRLAPRRPTLRALACVAIALSTAAAAVRAAPTDAAQTDAAPPRAKVCLVLSGGGARGIAHIGVLKVLEELRVPIDCVVGTSAGAIIGGAYASGASPAEIEAAMRGADWQQLLSDQPARGQRSLYAKELDRDHFGSAELGLRGTELVLPRGVVAGQHLQFFLQALVSPARRGPFDDLPIPYRALATDFENGQLVALDHGDLAAAIRASMSVPGAFAPVEIDDRLLVDGGLVRNVGIDVARELGASRVIVVNVGSPFLRREGITSLLNAAEQMLNILTAQNVDASLATLRHGDVLIAPDLGAFEATDFAHGVEQIPAGEQAARRAAGELAGFAVAEPEYSAWRERQRRVRVAPRYDQFVVDTTTLKRVPPAAVAELLGPDPDPRRADRAIAALLATDDFQTVMGDLDSAPGSTTLTLAPREKSWGPDYLHAGAELSSDFAGDSDFLLAVDQRMTWLDGRGLELRNRASVGRTNALGSELRVPLSIDRRTVLAPGLEVDDRLRSVYVDGEAIASYRLRRSRASLDLVEALGDAAELRAGVEYGRSSAARMVGTPLLPDFHQLAAAWRAALVLDRLDSLDFPRRGFLLTADARFARRMLGGEQAYDRLSLGAEQAFGSQRWSLLVAARYDTALGGGLPLDEAFTLGGFQNLSGYRRDQVLSDRVTSLRAVYRQRFARSSALLPALYGGLSLEGADVARLFDVRIPSRIYGGSVFIAADSPFGPVYLGTGLASGGFISMYLYLGRP